MGDKKIKSEETVENKSMNKELKKNDHIKDGMEKEKVKLTEGKTKKNDLGSNEEVQILERKKCRRRKSREEGELSHMDSEDIDNIVDWASGSDVNKSEKLTKKNICLKKSKKKRLRKKKKKGLRKKKKKGLRKKKKKGPRKKKKKGPRKKKKKRPIKKKKKKRPRKKKKKKRPRKKKKKEETKKEEKRRRDQERRKRRRD